MSAFTAKPLNVVTLGDLQVFTDTLAGLSANSQKRIIGGIKSLFTFSQKIGYLRFNVAAALKTPKIKSELAARILSEDEVLSMIHRRLSHAIRPLFACSTLPPPA